MLKAHLTCTVDDHYKLVQLLDAAMPHVASWCLTLAPDQVDECEPSPPAMPAGYDLTETEWTIIVLASQGLTRRHIANQLSLSPSTVATYWARIYHKLGIHSRAELFAWYRQQTIRQSSDAQSGR